MQENASKRMRPKWTRMETAVLLLLLTAGPTQAADTITFATTGAHSWDTSVVEHGKALGFFAANDIDVNFAVTDTAGLNLQAVISGSADIGVVAVPTFISAAIQGAPVKMIASTFKGASDFLWYVRSDSPIKSFKDISEQTKVGATTANGPSYVLVLALLDQYHVKGNVITYGTSAAGLTQVMTGQIDVATDGNGLLGVPEYDREEIRPIAYGREIKVMQGVTVRGLVVTNDTLAKRRNVLERFLKAYQQSVEWKYRDPRAIEWFARDTQSSLPAATRVRTEMYPEGVMDIGDVAGIDVSVQQGVAFKRIARAPTAEELARMFETVWRPGM